MAHGQWLNIQERQRLCALIELHRGDLSCASVLVKAE